MVSGISGMLFLNPAATAAAESYPSICDISVIISSSDVASDNPPFASTLCPFCFSSLFSSTFSLPPSSEIKVHFIEIIL